ncbi:hypothetical protein ACWFNE_12355 [Cellulomonas sp. NPDC055163]
MTATLESRLEASLTGPLDSQPANPLSAFEAEKGWSSPAFNKIVADARGAEDARRRARAPKEREAQQYLDDARRGRIDQARALTTADPNSPVSFARLAQALLGAGNSEEAVVAARQAATLLRTGDRLDAAEAMALFVAARTLVMTGALEEGESLLSKLDEPGPWALLSAAIAKSRGDASLALDRLAADQSADAAAFRGYLWLELRKPQLALAELRRARKLGVDSPSLLVNLAYAYACVGSVSKAIRAAQHAVRLAPHAVEVSFNLASYLRAAGRNIEAIEELRRLRREVGEGEPLVAEALAEAYCTVGRIPDALRELRRAQHHHDLPPDSPALAEVRANTALLQWRLGERTKDALVDVIRQQIKAAGPQVTLVTMLADVSDDHETARLVRQYYEEMVRKSDGGDALTPLLVRLHIAEGELDLAAQLAVEYAEQNPLDAPAVRSALVLQAQILGEYEAAAKSGVAAVRRAPGDVMLRNNVAFCLVLAGRASEAAALLDGIDAEDPYLLATRGMIAFAQRRTEEGSQWYDRAAAVARRLIAAEGESEAFVRLLRAYEVVAMRELKVDSSELLEDVCEAAGRPEDWPEERSFMILKKALRRISPS